MFTLVISVRVYFYKTKVNGLFQPSQLKELQLCYVPNLFLYISFCRVVHAYS